MNTVLICGAGAVRAAAGKSCSITKTPPLDRDFFEIARKAEPELLNYVESQLRQTIGGYATEVLQSLETATTFLYLKAIDASRNSPPHRAFLGMLTLIERILGRSTNAIPTGTRSLLYRLIRSELARLPGPGHLTVITFNYDLVIERVLDEIQRHQPQGVFSMPECYRLPVGRRAVPLIRRKQFEASTKGASAIALLKLHGSLNWQSPHHSQTPSSSALFNTGRELTVIDCPIVLHEISWTRSARKVYMRPIILPPVTGKRGLLHEDLASVWKKAERALNRANRLVIVGYSCPPLDLEARMLLGEMVRPDLNELVIVDPNPDVTSRFISLSGVPYAQLFTSVEALLGHVNLN